MVPFYGLEEKEGFVKEIVLFQNCSAALRGGFFFTFDFRKFLKLELKIEEYERNFRFRDTVGHGAYNPFAGQSETNEFF